MKKVRRQLPAWTLGAVLFSATAAVAAQGAGQGALPPEQQSGNVSWVSGGVGEGEAARFKAAESQYSLAIELSRSAKPRSEYVADADVKITDSKGETVLDAVAGGPFVLVKLPPGTYRVEAELEGKTVKSGPLKVGANRTARAALSFPANTGGR